jgi:hypothetical protein
MRTNQILPVPVHSGKAFKWTGNHGCCDVTDLPDIVATLVYRDACDVGFRVRGNREDKLFTAVGVDRSFDGEITAYNYRSEDGFTVRIYND